MAQALAPAPHIILVPQPHKFILGPLAGGGIGGEHPLDGIGAQRHDKFRAGPVKGRAIINSHTAPDPVVLE